MKVQQSDCSPSDHEVIGEDICHRSGRKHSYRGGQNRVLGDEMIRIRKDLCLGCGLCLDSCLREAISIVSGQAEIDQSRCDQCRACIESCPQDAIVELTPVSRVELEASVSALRSRADDILARIDALQKQRRGAMQDRS